MACGTDGQGRHAWAIAADTRTRLLRCSCSVIDVAPSSGHLHSAAWRVALTDRAGKLGPSLQRTRLLRCSCLVIDVAPSSEHLHSAAWRVALTDRAGMLGPSLQTRTRLLRCS